MKKINLQFTKEQFLELMRLAYLGEMVINGHKLPNELDKKAHELQEYIIEQAVRNNIKDYLHYFKGSKAYDLSLGISSEFFSLLEDSHEDYFSQEIVEIIAKNELFSRYTEQELEEMEDDKKEKVFSDIIDQVDNEFLENGYQNLRVQPYSKNPLFIKHNTGI